MTSPVIKQTKGSLRPGPLAGLKVVEIGTAMAGPYCAMILGDYGAEVVKIERVGQGDDSRHWPPKFHGKLPYYFAAANRNKRSLALDLKSADGVAIARKLIENADILIENYRVGAMERVGLGYETFAESNPGLIYCSISGFGRHGPRSTEPANDLFMQAYSGGMSITGEPNGGPVKMGMSVADLGAAMFGAIGILMAVEQRHRTGRGQRVDTSLLEGQMAMLSYHLTYFFATGSVPQRRGSSGQVNVPYQAFEASDQWVVIAAFNETMWRGVCRALERPQWAEDPRFCSSAQRLDNRDVLVSLISARLIERTGRQWIESLSAEGVPCAPVNDIEQLVGEAQALQSGMVIDLDVPGAGPIRMAGLPIKLSASAGDIVEPPPRLGQHSAEILSEIGYGSEAIRQLAAKSVVGLD